MKHGLRSLMRYYWLVNAYMMALFLTLITVPFAIFMVAYNLQDLIDHPFKASLSMAAAIGIASTLLLTSRYFVREAWKSYLESQKEPPSFGRPPAMPNSTPIAHKI